VVESVYSAVRTDSLYKADYVWSLKFYIKTYVNLYLARVFLEYEMFQTNDVEKIETHILCSITFSRKIISFY